jgi:hypothetical protein
MNRKVGWILKIFGLLAKVAVIMTTADILAYYFQGNYNVAFEIGLLLGFVCQHPIPPRGLWKREVLILMPIVILVGIVHAFLHH